MTVRNGLVLVITIAILVIGFKTYSYLYYKWLKSRPVMFPYETYFGPANSVLIIEDLKYKNDIVFYYDYMEKYKRDTSFSFPIKGLPQNKPVYVIEYSDDSLIVKIVSLYYRGRHFGGAFTEGWVAAKTLHNNPPPDSLLPQNYKVMIRK